MEWLNLHTSTLDSPEFIGSEPTTRATWLCMLRYCIGQENGGRIDDCRSWGDRRWQQQLRISKDEAEADSMLWSWDGDSIVVAFYPAQSQALVQVRRTSGRNGGLARTDVKAETSRSNGKLGGRPITQAKTQAEPKQQPKLNLTEGNGRKGEGEGKTQAKIESAWVMDTPPPDMTTGHDNHQQPAIPRIPTKEGLIMARGDGSPEDKAQATDRELGRRRISTVLAKRDMPRGEDALNGWDQALWDADFCCDDYGTMLERILEQAVEKGLKVKYARDAAEIITMIRPKRVNTEAKEAKRRLDEQLAKEAAALKAKPLTAEAQAIKDRLALARTLPKGTLPPPAAAKFGPDPGELGPMSDEEAAALDAQDGAALVVAQARTAPVAPEKLPDVAPPQSQEEDSMPW